MFRSVLIANRGEIAVRIIRTARRLGLRTIAVYSDADAAAPHVRLADAAVRIGPAPARDSYLLAERLIAAARETGAEAVHPGYGFLSERADFAAACAAAGLIFIGPPPPAIRAMGAKDGAKALMAKAGVPVVPGYHGDDQDPLRLANAAAEIGFPVLIKATAGGGGKGMRKVTDPAGFAEALASAKREAEGAFGDPRVLIERYVTDPRHIEIQVFADRHGNTVHLFERDCSLQRRHQKVIEEAPAPGLTPEMRAIMGETAVKAAQAVGYVGAGTVEFIADGSAGLKPDAFWFMEMNTRLQVEHPVTEAITGLDLVELQFRVAAGEALPLAQADLAIDGHAVEARLYAEDPERGFLPSTGRLWALDLPAGEGIRVDSGVEAGGEVSAHYDPMIAKIIAHAPTRVAALDRLASALDRTLVAGPRTNAPFLAALCRHAAFRAGRFDTGFIDRHLDELLPQRGADPGAVAAAAERLVRREQARLSALARSRSDEAGSPWDVLDAFDLAGPREVGLQVAVDGDTVTAQVRYLGPDLAVSVGGTPAAAAAVIDAGEAVIAIRHGRQAVVRPKDIEATDVEHLDQGGVVTAPMHGKLLALAVGPGDAVHKGQTVAVIEAMKMEHALLAPLDGTVAEVAVSVGAQVADGAKILVITPAEG
ncbi:acetyl-CoA carboxylase biotin carboxylase subunit [Blastochloris viridis]|uniref:Acetyl-/propionyl-coenzyme A carboxylase alpha chain n=1 Tax=Blastochloris viridis TaxID=1079 RepID=A0A0H5BK29_BLAVI|nr:acetyl/propionyl/methylcrotonyl-CoA carboxylase subunit alpha [Blastochloris viridis]ALK09234.1 Acetyl-/propionyl-coenzyme A carboxylase alpha chain [Blastochloris viridis]BAS00897.1 methylcrotonyl-CoA carboxylase biotin-containing subunit [Blastochloris viridis]CUU41897.1 Acetyl-/propionyl-coenzyme A carboxylase alpha chain [Blastochloris viridis]